jgi:steroid 5-alpha reductase family enzyme
VTPILTLNFMLLTGLMTALWLYCVRIKDVSVIDSFWAFGMVIMAATSFVQGDGDRVRSILLLALCALWGLRLSLHLFRRWRAHGVDPRYARILGGLMEKKQWSFAKASFVQVFALQAVLLFIVCLPVQLGQIDPAAAPMGALGWAGATIAIIGIAFETIGDAQLNAHRNNPAMKGRVLDTGLWRYTRHPNYFGDAATWWGLWLIAAETALGLWSMIGPILLTYLLTRLSGVPMLERGLAKTRPGYAEYVARTSSFFPWPPKKTNG